MVISFDVHVHTNIDTRRRKRRRRVRFILLLFLLLFLLPFHLVIFFGAMSYLEGQFDPTYEDSGFDSPLVMLHGGCPSTEAVGGPHRIWSPTNLPE